MQKPVDGPLVPLHSAEAVGLKVVSIKKVLPATERIGRNACLDGGIVDLEFGAVRFSTRWASDIREGRTRRAGTRFVGLLGSSDAGLTVPLAVVVWILEVNADAVEPGLALGAADPGFAVGSGAFARGGGGLSRGRAGSTVELGFVDRLSARLLWLGMRRV